MRLENTQFSDLVMRSGLFGIMPQPAGAANKSYEQTELHQALIVNADAMGYSFDVSDERPIRLVKTFFMAVSTFMSLRKESKPDQAVALIIQDLNGVFKMGAIVEYTINETNPDEPGNWSYVLTFNESDITELEKRKEVKKYLSSDDVFKSVMDKMAYDVGGIQFDRESYIYDACRIVIDSLIQVLDHEAVEGKVIDINMEGYFTAMVAIENGEKVFSITPDGHLKAIIKSDVMLDQ